MPQVAIANQVPYCVSKGGLAQLTKVMALSLAPYGIRVNAIGPGSIMTDILKSVATDREAKRRILARTPLGRIGDPDEIAAIAVFLASADSSYITGQTIYADGGRLALNYVAVPRGGRDRNAARRSFEVRLPRPVHDGTQSARPPWTGSTSRSWPNCSATAAPPSGARRQGRVVAARQPRTGPAAGGRRHHRRLSGGHRPRPSVAAGQRVCRDHRWPSMPSAGIVERRLAAIEEVVECWEVTGTTDYIARFICADLAAYEALTTRLIDDPNLGVARIVSHVALRAIRRFAGYPRIAVRPQSSVTGTLGRVSTTAAARRRLRRQRHPSRPNSPRRACGSAAAVAADPL